MGEDERWRTHQAWLHYWIRQAGRRLKEADIHENVRILAHIHLRRATRAARGNDVDAMNTHLETVGKYLKRVHS